MAVNLNRVLLAGNLTRDPQMRFLANEKAVAEFGLAINRRFKAADGEMKEEVTFVDVEAWGRTAELVGQYLTKGRSCFVEGRLKLDQWDDKQTGQKRSRLRVVADHIQFIGGNQERGGQDEEGADGQGTAPVVSAAPAARGPAAPARRASAAAPVAELDDEPPF